MWDEQHLRSIFKPVLSSRPGLFHDKQELIWLATQKAQTIGAGEVTGSCIGKQYLLVPTSVSENIAGFTVNTLKISVELDFC